MAQVERFNKQTDGGRSRSLRIRKGDLVMRYYDDQVANRSKGESKATMNRMDKSPWTFVQWESPGIAKLRSTDGLRREITVPTTSMRPVPENQFVERKMHRFFDTADAPTTGAELSLYEGDHCIIKALPVEVRDQLKGNQLNGDAKWFVGKFHKYKRDAQDRILSVHVHLMATRKGGNKPLEARQQLYLYQRTGRITRASRRAAGNDSLHGRWIQPYVSEGFEAFMIQVSITKVLPIANVNLTSRKVVDSKSLKSISNWLKR